MDRANSQNVEATGRERIGGGAGISTTQFLTFQLAGEIYAINILHIREIIDYGNLTQVPMVPNFIAGVINLRGSVVPVVDLGERFGKQRTRVTKRTSIVIIEIEDHDKLLEIGITVDHVNEVLEISSADIQLPPSFGANIRTDFIAGMGKVNGKFMVLLDVDRVLSIEELSEVDEIHSTSGPNDHELDADALH